MPDRPSGLAIAITIAALLSCTACLYIPPVRDTAGVDQVRAAQDGDATRTAWREHLRRERPLLDTPAVAVYEWSQTFGYLLVIGYGSAGIDTFEGKHFHVLLHYDGERVSSFEWDVAPRPKDVTARAAFSAAPEFAVREQDVAVAGADGARCVAYSAAGERCLAAFADEGSAWVVQRGPEAGRLALPWAARADRPWAVAHAAPTGAWLVAARGLHSDRWGAWRLPDGAPTALPRRREKFVPLAFCPEGDALVGRSRKEDVALFDLAAARVAWRAAPFDRPARSASAAGARVAIATDRGDVALLDRANGAVVARLAVPEASTTGRAVALSPDGRRLAIASSAHLEIWDVAALEEAQRGHDGALPSVGDDVPAEALRAAALLPAACGGPEVVFSRDGARLAVISGASGILFDDAAQVVGTFALPVSSAFSPTTRTVSFDPDGRELIVTVWPAAVTLRVRLDGTTERDREAR